MLAGPELLQEFEPISYVTLYNPLCDRLFFQRECTDTLNVYARHPSVNERFRLGQQNPIARSAGPESGVYCNDICSWTSPVLPLLEGQCLLVLSSVPLPLTSLPTCNRVSAGP